MEGYTRPLSFHLPSPSAESPQPRLLPVACTLDTLHSGLVMLPIHREGAIWPLPWFICLTVVAHDSQVPSDTWDPEDPRPSFFGWAVYWARAKSRISATACGSLSGQLAGGTQLQWIPAAPTVMAEVGPRCSVRSAVPELPLSSRPWPRSLELLLAAVPRGFGYSKPMRICGSRL